MASNLPTAKRTYWRFAFSLLCGFLSLFIVGFFGSIAMLEIVAVVIFMFWVMGSALVSARLSLIQPGVCLVWNLGYSVPVALWGASFLLMMPYESGSAMWFTFSLLPLLFGIIGDRVARKFMRSRLSNNNETISPVEY